MNYPKKIPRVSPRCVTIFVLIFRRFHGRDPWPLGPLGLWASTICREVFKAIDKQGDGMITEERCAGRAEQLAVGR